MDAPAPQPADRPASPIEQNLEKALLGARWILVVFYFGLAAALAVYAFSFLLKFFKLASHVFDYNEGEMILGMLGLIDAALVASLVVMVMISGYENFVSRFDNEDGPKLAWLGKLDAGSLKVKVASSIVAISSIHLLQVFLNANQFDNAKIGWLTLIHVVFVISAVALALLDRLMSHSHADKG